MKLIDYSRSYKLEMGHGIWKKDKRLTKISVEVLESTSVRLAFAEVSNYREPMFREGRMPHQKRQDLSLPE